MMDEETIDGTGRAIHILQAYERACPGPLGHLSQPVNQPVSESVSQRVSQSVSQSVSE